MIEHLLAPLVPEKFLSDPAYRRGHIRVINPLPGTRVMGLHIPEMKKTASRLATASPEGGPGLISRFEAAPDKSLLYEEYMIWGLILNRLKISREERTDRFRKFIPHIDNWAVCDCICADARWAGPDTGTWEFIRPYLSSNKEFEVRFALILYMARAMREESLGEMMDIMQGIDQDRIHSDYVQGRPAGKDEDPCCGTVAGRPPFYVRTAMAWLLATALARWPETTRSLLSATSLPDDVLKLYVRKARESFRTRNITPF